MTHVTIRALAVVLVGLVMFPSMAAAQRRERAPIPAMVRGLRNAQGYAGAERERIAAELTGATRAIEGSSASDACKALARRRVDALATTVTASPARAATQAWQAARRIVAALAECGSEEAAAPSEGLVSLEVATWAGAAPEGSRAEAAAAQDGSPRALLVRGMALLAASQWQPARARFEAGRAALGDADPILGSDFARGIGEAQLGAGRMSDALAALEDARRRAEAAGDPGRRALADAWMALGTAHARARRFADAASAYERAAALRQALVGASDPWVAEALGRRAVALGELDRTDDAIAASQSVLAIQERGLGVGHPDTLTSRSNIAMMLQRRGDLPGALAMHQQILDTRTRVLGEDDPSVAVTLDAIAFIERTAGRHAEAEALLRRAIGIRERSLPPGHPDRGRSHRAIAPVLVALGRMDEAMQMAERSVLLTIESVGPDHPDVAAAYAAMLQVAQAVGRQDAIERAQREIARIRAASGAR